MISKHAFATLVWEYLVIVNGIILHYIFAFKFIPISIFGPIYINFHLIWCRKNHIIWIFKIYLNNMMIHNKINQEMPVKANMWTHVTKTKFSWILMKVVSINIILWLHLNVYIMLIEIDDIYLCHYSFPMSFWHLNDKLNMI